MKNETLTDLIVTAKAVFGMTKQDRLANVIDEAEAELERRQRDVRDDPITITREEVEGLNWRPSRPTFYCPAADGQDFELFAEVGEGDPPIVGIFINGEYVIPRGVKTVGDLIDFARLLTGKGITK